MVGVGMGFLVVGTLDRVVRSMGGVGLRLIIVGRGMGVSRSGVRVLEMVKSGEGKRGIGYARLTEGGGSIVDNSSFL
jgi:hypothetical protein